MLSKTYERLVKKIREIHQKLLRPKSSVMGSYERFVQKIREIHLLGSACELLGWDKEIYMPPKGGAARADQIALLSSLAHERLVCPEMEELLVAVEELVAASGLPADAPAAVNARETRASFDREKKLPKRLVQEIARARSLATAAWEKAREESDFAIFKPHLETGLALQREAAELYGYDREHGDLFDALLEEFEPGMTVAKLQPMFATLRGEVVDILQQVQASGRPTDLPPLQREYPPVQQEAFAKQMAAAIGFDFEAGRLDTAAHPFSVGISIGDARLTARYKERNPFESVYCVMHEAGHGLYEQGFDPQHEGTPMARGVSLGIHESQSRLWENLVGRSRAFWTFALPAFRAAFPGVADDVDLDTLYAGANAVKPGLIRFGSDEVTYNLHIVLRFEIEHELLHGRLAIDDLPAAWNERVEKYLGLTPPNDAVGVLQDVHWSMYYFGYFPTYTLGNLYSAQLFETVRAAMPDLDGQMARGEFAPLLGWLRENIHRHGMRYKADALIERVTGKPPSSEAFVTYLRRKYLG